MDNKKRILTTVLLLLSNVFALKEYNKSGDLIFKVSEDGKAYVIKTPPSQSQPDSLLVKLADSSIGTYPMSFDRSMISDFWEGPFWDQIPDKPDSFQAIAHSHSLSDVTGLNGALAGKEPTITGSTSDNFWNGLKQWVNITIGNVLGLNDTITNHRTAIASKLNISDTSSLARKNHGHLISEITNLQTTLDNKQPLDTDLTAIAGLTHSNRHVLISDGSTWTRRVLAEDDLPSLSISKTTGLQSVLDGKSNTGHNHNRLIGIADTRDVATTPNDYPRSVIPQFKRNTAIELSAGGTYSTTLGIFGWNEQSGGHAHELAFNSLGIYNRIGSPDSSWGNWKRLLTTGDISTYVAPAITGTENKVLSIQAGGSGVKTGSISDNGTTGFFDNGLVGQYASTARHYHDVLSYSNTATSVTGAIKIVMPKSWSNTMMTIVIKGYDHFGGQTNFEYRISGYNYLHTTDAQWMNFSSQILGNPPSNRVRLAHDGDRCVILLGETTTQWRYPKIIVSEMLTGHGDITGWETGWSASIISSETGITNIVTPTTSSYGNDAVIPNTALIGKTTATGGYRLEVEGNALVNGNARIEGSLAMEAVSPFLTITPYTNGGIIFNTPSGPDGQHAHWITRSANDGALAISREVNGERSLMMAFAPNVNDILFNSDIYFSQKNLFDVCLSGLVKYNDVKSVIFALGPINTDDCPGIDLNTPGSNDFTLTGGTINQRIFVRNGTTDVQHVDGCRIEPGEFRDFLKTGTGWTASGAAISDKSINVSSGTGNISVSNVSTVHINYSPTSTYTLTNGYVGQRVTVVVLGSAQHWIEGAAKGHKIVAGEFRDFIYTTAGWVASAADYYQN